MVKIISPNGLEPIILDPSSFYRCDKYHGFDPKKFQDYNFRGQIPKLDELIDSIETEFLRSQEKCLSRGGFCICHEEDGDVPEDWGVSIRNENNGDIVLVNYHKVIHVGRHYPKTELIAGISKKDGEHEVFYSVLEGDGEKESMILVCESVSGCERFIFDELDSILLTHMERYLTEKYCLGETNFFQMEQIVSYRRDHPQNRQVENEWLKRYGKQFRNYIGGRFKEWEKINHEAIEQKIKD